LRRSIGILFAGLATLATIPATVFVTYILPVGDFGPLVLPAIFSLLLGATFAAKWPRGSWRWGILASAACWLFFGYVYVALLRYGENDWTPLITAIAALSAGCLGALLGKACRFLLIKGLSR
jgi:hypothetical protein